MQTKRPVCESFALLTFQFYSRCRQCLQAPSLTIVCNLLFKQCQTMFTCLLQTITRLQFCITLAASISLSLSIVPRNPRTRHPCPDKMYPQQRVAAVAVTGYDRRLPLLPAIIWRSCTSNWLLAIMVLRSAGVRLPPALTCDGKHHDGEALHPPHDDLKVHRIR